MARITIVIETRDERSDWSGHSRFKRTLPARIIASVSDLAEHESVCVRGIKVTEGRKAS